MLCAAVLAIVLALVAAVPARAELRPMPDRDDVARQLECLALNIYWEAGLGDDIDLRAVAHVTANRLAHPKFPGDVCGVVMQGGERPLYGCQFHWWCDGRSDAPTDLARWRKALGIAEEVLAGEDEDPTAGALYFHNTTVQPGWADILQPTIQIGGHLFYR